eukprot:SAG11_NODE_219_length_12168_cov_5.600083_8_plen_59_part_00
MADRAYYVFVQPILVTVEESNDVAAFKDFVADAAPVLAAEPEPEPVALVIFTALHLIS